MTRPHLRRARHRLASTAATLRATAATLRDRLAFPLAVLVLASAVGAVVLVVATELFPYHSVNDDESVYLAQAAMLLEGKLWLTPGPLAEAVRPWFFVVDRPPYGPGADPALAGGTRLYPKYTPVAAAVFAPGVALGAPRVVLGVVAAGSVALLALLAAEAYDRPTGLLAGATLATAPLFVLTSATFLSYAPTTLLNLAFAYAYVRSFRAAGRRRRLAWGAVAGTATGLAFFARSYTAVLFAAPFVAHTCWRLWRAWRTERSESEPATGTTGTANGTGSRRGGGRVEGLRAAATRAFAVAIPGLVLVGVTLAYNAVVTGDALLFPYEAFAPRDGLGFGRRAILGYERTYTPAIAAETAIEAVRLFVVRWGPAGPLGTVLAAIGLGRLAVGIAGRGTAGQGRERSQGRRGRRGDDPRTRLSARELRVVLASLVPAVVLGEMYFWGTWNGLRNGLIDLLGPYYHFDLLVPAAVFAAAGAVALVRRARASLEPRMSPAELRGVALVALLVTAPAVAGIGASAFADPVSENARRTATLAATYEPIETHAFDDAVVFLPTPYGDWIGHPFQTLRNDPGLDGPVVYVTDGPPDRDLLVLGALNRTPYRFTYRGIWTGGVRPVEPELERLRVLRGDRVDATTTLGVPRGATSASVRLEVVDADGDGGDGDGRRGDGSDDADDDADGADPRYARYRATPDGETLTVNWTVAPDGARVTGRERAFGPERLPMPDGATEVDLVVTFVDVGGSSVTYRQELTVGVTDGDDGTAEVRAVWPPETRVCRLRTACGTAGTWIGPDGDYVAGVSVTTDARARNASANG